MEQEGQQEELRGNQNLGPKAPAYSRREKGKRKRKRCQVRSDCCRSNEEE